MDKNKLDALISLLDDTNPEVFKSVAQKLTEFPHSVVPTLENIWLESENKLLQERLEGVIKKIEFNKIKNELVKWSKSESPNLIEGAILVSKSYNPHLSKEPILKEITKIKTDVQSELSNYFTALEKIKALNHIFFTIYNYRPLSKIQPTNWDGDISTVISQRQGNYIIMAILYAGIAQSAKIPVYGVNLTGSVLLCHEDTDANLKNEDSRDILFYINPIDQGNIFGRTELEYIIKKKKISNLKSHYLPCSNTILVKRLIEHEINVCKKLKLEGFIPNFKELLECL